MIFLFIGFILSGIYARVTLLTQRGGDFEREQAEKSNLVFIVYALSLISGLAAFAVSFLIFDWWWPLIAFTLGYWIAGPILVNNNSYPIFHKLQMIILLGSIGCSMVILNLYFELIG